MNHYLLVSKCSHFLTNRGSFLIYLRFFCCSKSFSYFDVFLLIKLAQNNSPGAGCKKTKYGLLRYYNDSLMLCNTEKAMAVFNNLYSSTLPNYLWKIKSLLQETTLMVATQNGHIEAVRYLVRRGASLNTISDKGVMFE